MSFAEAVRTCLQKYATFSGRASRPEFWYFALFLLLGGLAAGVLDGLLFGAGRLERDPGRIEVRAEGPVSAIWALAMLLPLLAAGWRRMHDTGRSGIFLFYPLLVMLGLGSFLSVADALMPGAGPTVGQGLVALFWLTVAVLLVSPLLVLWWLASPSEPRTNAFGPPPRPSLPR